MKRVCLVFSFACLFLLPWAAGEAYTGKVVGITDGDTILAMRDGAPERVRLHGIDTPESGQDFGARAKEYLGALCHQEDVTVAITDKDRYGRTVGTVVLGDGRVVNHELVAEGLAWWYREYAPEDKSIELLEAAAKASKVGLWGQGTPTAPWDFRRGEGGTSTETSTNEETLLNPITYTSPRATERPANAAGTDVRIRRDLQNQGVGTVYITRTGSKYHSAGCQYLRSSQSAIPLARAKARYEPCSRCNPPK